MTSQAGDHRATNSGDEVLPCGELARLLYRLGRARAVGVLSVTPVHAQGRQELFTLRRGYLVAASICPQNRPLAKRLARLSSMGDVHYRFYSGKQYCPSGVPLRQFFIEGWARAHIEGQVTTMRAYHMVAELAGTRLSVIRQHVPDLRLCDDTDLRILAAMHSPQHLEQIWTHARTPRFRLLSFLHFLRAVGALRVEGGATEVAKVPQATAAQQKPSAAHRLLGVSADADSETIKRAYHKLARLLHPDLQPHVSGAGRRILERKLAAVTRAYMELTGTPTASPRAV